MGDRVFRRIGAWRVPPNWSPRDWFEEMRAEAAAAAWLAELDFDPTRGVPLTAFVHQRVWARARARYRQEWAYALRCGAHPEGSERDVADDGLSPAGAYESLRDCLERLSELHRGLIESLFWEEQTEAEVARTLSISQTAVSKRKRRILEQLRRWLGRPEKMEGMRF
jgi:DNA-directed RNA polymerase specialized sigma24 family protein